MISARTTATTALGAMLLVAVPSLTGCGSTGPDVAVERVVVCAGPDEQHPAGTPVEVSLRQGGREVASAATQRGSLVALLVPDAPTAVFTGGVRTGVVAFGGEDGDRDPESLPAPDDATVVAVAATDPADVDGYIGMTGPGCPPASDLRLG